jgi:hypothetical protein
LISAGDQSISIKVNLTGFMEETIEKVVAEEEE